GPDRGGPAAGGPAAGPRGRRAGAAARRPRARDGRRRRPAVARARGGGGLAYEAVIGLECHIQLTTNTKMFCDCPAAFGAAPNSHVCPVCLGLPGALPRVNGAAVAAAVRLGLPLGWETRGGSGFARAHA